MEAYTEKKYLQVNADGSSAAVTPNPLDPAAMDGMIGMIKKQAVSFVPQSILMGWINLFFSGFVLSRLIGSLLDRGDEQLRASDTKAGLSMCSPSTISPYNTIQVDDATRD